MTHEEIQIDLSSFALGALDAAERQEIEQHLAAGCATCEQELATWREVVGLMGLAGQEARSPDLKPQLLQRLQPSKPAKVIRVPRWSLVPLAAAALAVLILGIAREVGMRQQLEEQRQQVASLQHELDTAHGDLQRLTAQLAAQEHDVAGLRAALAAAQESLAVLQTPGLQLVQLKEAPHAPPAEAHALISADTRRALFYAFDLPTVGPDKTYELWWITEKEGPVKAGLFLPDQKGLGRVEAALPAAAGAIQAAAVTVEPAGGVPKPTGPMVLIGNLRTS